MLLMTGTRLRVSKSQEQTRADVSYVAVHVEEVCSDSTFTRAYGQKKEGEQRNGDLQIVVVWRQRVLGRELGHFGSFQTHIKPVLAGSSV